MRAWATDIAWWRSERTGIEVGTWFRDSGFGIRDAGFGIRESGFGFRV